ncbi:MAG: Gmad2 immunoglobulin-like domain-containing protein [Acidimicrobiales bacterium]
MTATRRPHVALLLAFALMVGACGDDDGAADDATTSTDDTGATTTTADSSTTADGSSTTTDESTTSAADGTTTTADGSSTTADVDLGQPAIWPDAGTTFATPEEAAEDFVEQVLGVPPTLGEFMQGDSRSGEIEVFSPGEGGSTQIARSVLLLRQLGPDDGWFVLGAVNANMTIDSPQSAATVAAGDLAVDGTGRGFEGTVVVEAFVAGDGTAVDQQIAQGGSMEDSEPFSVTLDLSAAQPGDTVMVLIRGGVGLETDPGEFSAIPVVVEG